MPADYRLEVTVTPPPLRASIEGAAYYPAPPFKTSGVGRFYVTPTGDDVAELRQEHNYAAMPDLAGHEGFPGHDWHYKVMTQYREQISPVRWLTPGAVEDSSSMWQDSMAAEGWALYAEALLAEPQPRRAAAASTLRRSTSISCAASCYRDLRVRIDTGMHTGRPAFRGRGDAVLGRLSISCPAPARTPRRSKLEAKQASCKAARAAVTRYARWPTQAITYRLGKEQILELRQRAQPTARRALSPPQRFHLEFMKQGTIPAGLLRRGAAAGTAHRDAAGLAAGRCAPEGGCFADVASDRRGLTDEQVRRQHVQRLELAPHVTEDALQVLQHARRELVDAGTLRRGSSTSRVLRRMRSRNGAGMVLNGMPEMM